MNWHYVIDNLPKFIEASLLTLHLAFWGIFFSLIIGLICAILTSYRLKGLSLLANAYIELSRNTLLFAWAKENPGFTVSIKNLGDQDFIAPAVKKGNTQLLNWLNDEIIKLGKNGTLKQAYNKTLLPIYGDTIKESDVLVNYAN